MIKFQTIQKVAEDMGIDISYIRTMIKNKDLTAHKKDGYKRIYIDVEELNNSIKPVDSTSNEINLDNFLI
ncbi:helix-turn-helix domain-containing protein [bacterium]|nr:helix-turn-helix domain-containing protein [bacterium]MBU1990277.1 helix-turn-helix domain-containing protein [bacterium]